CICLDTGFSINLYLFGYTLYLFRYGGTLCLFGLCVAGNVFCPTVNYGDLDRHTFFDLFWRRLFDFQVALLCQFRAGFPHCRLSHPAYPGCFADAFFACATMPGPAQIMTQQTVFARVEVVISHIQHHVIIFMAVFTIDMLFLDSEYPTHHAPPSPLVSVSVSHSACCSAAVSAS